jgi:murein tripeptide amidase MpaA
MNTDDLWLLKKIGEMGSKITGYRCVSTYHDFKYHPKEIISGAFDDWMYDHLGVISYTIELWDLPSEAGIKDRKFIEWFQDHPHEEDLQILNWVDGNTGVDGFVNWYEFDHPQFGKVELGGWNSLYTWRNPPVNLVSAEAERNTPFILTLAELLPHLEIHTLEVSKLGPNSYHLNLVIENSGFLPTYTTEQGKSRKVVRPVRVELDIPESIEILTGERRVELAHLEGRSNKLSVAPWDYSPTDNRARVEWVLQAESSTKLEIRILSERAGKITEKVCLE